MSYFKTLNVNVKNILGPSLSFAFLGNTTQPVTQYLEFTVKTSTSENQWKTNFLVFLSKHNRTKKSETENKVIVTSHTKKSLLDTEVGGK